MNDFDKWWADNMPGVKEEHVVGGLYCGRLAWNGRSAIADARVAELRAEVERLKAENEGLRDTCKKLADAYAALAGTTTAKQ